MVVNFAGERDGRRWSREKERDGGQHRAFIGAGDELQHARVFVNTTTRTAARPNARSAAKDTADSGEPGEHAAAGGTVAGRLPSASSLFSQIQIATSKTPRTKVVHLDEIFNLALRLNP